MLPKIRRILYASDLSENSIPALSWAMMLAHQHDARITFLHVIEDVSPHATTAIRHFMGEDKWKEMAASHHADVSAKAEERIRRFCDNVSSEISPCPATVSEIAVTRGVPVESILEEAELRDSDLIVMGTHGAGLFKDAMIGSTARRVLRRSQRPVFVIPLTNIDS